MSLPTGVRSTPVSSCSPLKWMEEHAVYDSESGAEVRFFGMFEPPDLTGASETETVLRVEDVNMRLDLLAYDVYGDVNLYWFLAYYNDLDIPDAYFYRGMELAYPSKEWVQENVVNRPRTQRRIAV